MYEHAGYEEHNVRIKVFCSSERLFARLTKHSIEGIHKKNAECSVISWREIWLAC